MSVLDKSVMNSAQSLKLRIADLMSEYVHCIDDERFEEWPSFFTEDCSYRVTTRAAVARGYLAGIIDCESKGMLIDRINSLRHANIYEPHVYRHQLGPIRILGFDDNTVRARTGFVVMRIVEGQGPEVFLTGVYDDTFTCSGADLKIAERSVILDSSMIDTLLVIPV